MNGKPATLSGRIPPGATILTGADGRATFVVGDNAFLLRASSRMQLVHSGGNAVLGGLRLLTGALLSVFGPGPKRLDTPAFTMGIRGTGVYLRTSDTESYACTCYGAVEMADHAGTQKLDVLAAHHSAKRIVKEPSEGATFASAGFEDHTDDELVMLEALVARRPPFASGKRERRAR